MLNNKEIYHSRKVVFLLAMIGGILEIYSYIEKDGVFATTITGNLVLMMYNFVNFKFNILPKYLVPIIFFILGVIFVECINKNRWKGYILILEIIMVLVVPYIPNLIGVSLIAFVSALQVQSFRKIEEDIYMSTMCTGNTRSFVEALIHRNYRKATNYAIVISAFLLGVAFEYIGIIYLNQKAVYICIPILILIIYIVNFNKEKK